jgi:hypothetical protein
MPCYGAIMFLLTPQKGRLHTFTPMLRFIVYTLGIIFLYRFIVNFLWPMLQVTRTAGKRIREMQQQMNDMQQPQNNQHVKSNPPCMKEGDYIDYEEIK